MIRTATVETLAALVEAARASDRELDRALSDVGVLPPMELREIRHVLTARDAHVTARSNPDGHCLIEVTWDEGGACIHPDGRVQARTTTSAA